MVSTDVKNNAVAQLRAATRGAHETVDAAFGGYDLTTRDGYRDFLIAHARALPVAEARMRTLAFARTLTPRTPLLAADLAALGVAMPAPAAADTAPDTAPDTAAAWGTLYVVEGSRLGGAMLARGVPDGLPAAYLGAVHGPGDWRTIRAAIDAAAVDRDDAWRERMTAGALASFDLYARAAVTD